MRKDKSNENGGGENEKGWIKYKGKNEKGKEKEREIKKIKQRIT